MRWESNSVADFSSQALNLLLAGRVPAVRVTDFCGQAELERLVASLHAITARSQTLGNMVRMGISQYQEGVCGDKAEYFAMAERLQSQQQALYANSFDPVERLCGRLNAVGFNARVLEEPGFGRYYAGVCKKRWGPSSVHVDFSAQDSPGWRVGKARAQLAWNLYLNTPTGGALQVWDRQWTRCDDVHRSDRSFTYSESVVAGTEHVEIPVMQGDVLLINSRNYHAVADTGPRLTFGSFISLFPERELALWS